MKYTPEMIDEMLANFEDFAMTDEELADLKAKWLEEDMTAAHAAAMKAMGLTEVREIDLGENGTLISRHRPDDPDAVLMADAFADALRKS